MKITILKNDKNELLNRFEVKAQIEEKIIPTREEIRKQLAVKLSAKEENVIIKKIASKFGTITNIIDARIYDNEKDLLKNERKYMINRNKPKKVEEKKE
ncbi:MAG: hypothetical protein PHX27_00740 [Candidatus ainarchaeum sp.]|nr:hypothetical protein [Candidatus ainarchaeum sp.]